MRSTGVIVLVAVGCMVALGALGQVNTRPGTAGGSGSVQTNAAQFGANPVLTLKPAALQTNMTGFGSATNRGDVYVEGGGITLSNAQPQTTAQSYSSTLTHAPRIAFERYGSGTAAAPGFVPAAMTIGSIDWYGQGDSVLRTVGTLSAKSRADFTDSSVPTLFLWTVGKTNSGLSRQTVWSFSAVATTNATDFYMSSNLTVAGSITLPSLGAASVGTIVIGDTNGTNFTFQMPSLGSTDVVYRLPKNATPGVMVAISEGVGTNQMTNVTLTAGQFVTWNGTTLVASNPVAYGFNNLTNSVATNATAGQLLQYDGVNWTNITQSAQPLPSSPSAPAWGAVLAYDGTNAAWMRGADNWVNLIDEEFIGFGASSSLGREAWQLSSGGNGTTTGIFGESGAPGILHQITTNAADRTAAYLGSANNSCDSILMTNLEFWCLSRVRTMQTNNTADIQELDIGLLNQVSAAPTRGVYWRNVTNIAAAQTWQGVIANATTFTFCTGSNVVVGEWTWLGWRLDTTGTNVTFYQGGSPSTLMNMGTYSNNIPLTTVGPSVRSSRVTGVTANRCTNNVDVFKLWARRLP